MFVNSEDTANPTSEEAAPQPTNNRRRLSVVRILAVVLVAGGATAGLWYGFHDNGSDAAAAVSQSWFAPYVDVTATPQYAFEEP
jgi:chitinase